MSGLFGVLPPESLAEVASVGSPNHFLFGCVFPDRGFVFLVRGDFSPLHVPFSCFPASGTATPEFEKFEILDYGGTIRFGSYEASAGAVIADWNRLQVSAPDLELAIDIYDSLGPKLPKCASGCGGCQWEIAHTLAVCRRVFRSYAYTHPYDAPKSP